MYASQTKRLCVRGASSDETTRVQHHNSNSTTESTTHRHNNPAISSNKDQSAVAGGNMTASAGVVTGIDNNETRTAALTTSDNIHLSSHHDASKEASSELDLINKLASETLEETKLELLIAIRDRITACNKKKDSVVSSPNFSKIINSIHDDISNSPAVKTQLALLLCSVAKSGEHNIKILNELLVDDKIFNLILNSQDEALIEACLRCMRSIMAWPKVSRTWLLYEQPQINSSDNLQPKDKVTSTSWENLSKIIAYARNSNSFIVQECIADIFASTCLRNKNQVLLYQASAIPCIIQFLESSSNRVIIATLNWLTQMCLRNSLVSSEIVKSRCPSNTPVLDRLTSLMNKDRCSELQFLSARCFAHIYRANIELKNDNRIIAYVIPTLVRMVHRNNTPELRIKSAECIAYLIEGETKLQNIASVCDHLIESLANMLEYTHNWFGLKNCNQTQYKCSRFHDRGISWLSITTQVQQQHLQQQPPPPLDLRPAQPEPSKVEPTNDSNSELNQEMKRAAFLALASLASNLEPIRKKIFNICSIMQHLVKSLGDSDAKTLRSVLTCLLSLSRSVQQLRTSFAENTVYSALKSLLSTSSNDVLILVLAILCNISLDFSPGKQHFLDSKTIEILCNLTRKSDPVLRLHGMWILMNMVYQLKDLNLKFQIIKSLGMNHVMSLVEIEDDDETVLKTLGFLRNLLSQRSHIDAIMNSHGDQIMQLIVCILEKPCLPRIKEQSLCVLTNIADGNESKTFIMNNRTVLSYLARTICDEQAGDLRLAAICCITNLAHKEYEKSQERRTEMKKFGIEEKLKEMLNTNDPILSDRVRTAYNQFLIGVEDKYVN